VRVRVFYPRTQALLRSHRRTGLRGGVFLRLGGRAPGRASVPRNGGLRYPPKGGIPMPQVVSWRRESITPLGRL